MGSSSPNAGEILKKEGHNNILILKGGINQWKIDNLPLV
jgi:rhodanese-related sulfurtransferase